MKSSLTIGVLGAGAVGCYFGARLAQGGEAVTLVARAAHADAIARDGVVVRTAGRTEVVRVAATTDASAMTGVDVVLVAVKSGDTEATADLIVATRIPPDTLIVSLQNGVDNAWRLRARVPNPVVPAVVYVSAEMAAPGIVQHNGGGRIVVGAPLASEGQKDAASERLDDLVTRLNDAGVPCDRSADVRVDLWTKLATNCAYNAISALTGLRYGAIVEHDEAREVMTRATEELVAVARTDGVALSPDAAHDAVRKIVDVMPGALSSTAQDLQSGRRTEIDHINGYVLRRGRALGIPTPVNQALTMLVTLAEQSRRG